MSNKDSHHDLTLKETRSSFSIVFPPPNVTGRLHMGHAFQQILMDISAKYNVMLGKELIWIPGTDHAGIATQMIVEKELHLRRGLSRQQISHQEFLELAYSLKESSREQIIHQMKRLGLSANWECERFTLDEGFSSVVKQTFVRLYKEGIIYQGVKMIHWDPLFATAISDAEVVYKEVSTKMWNINYKLVNEEGYITVATTRPETLFGDVALMIHPEDTRYIHLLGKTAKIPIIEREIPIIADKSISPEFGTGCVKITPAHDFTDYELGLKHNLKPINILDKKAKLNNNVPSEFRSLSIQEARQAVLNTLGNLDVLVSNIDIKSIMPYGDRSQSILEPLLTKQWFVKTTVLAEASILAVLKSNMVFHPSSWADHFVESLKNMQDWCISRQILWGHRIPAWYDQSQQVYVGNSEEEIRKEYNLPTDLALTQDSDVLDTWFSSALWPLITLGWPDKNPIYHPHTLLITGFDILFFWVARMLMLSLYLTKQVPAINIVVTGLIRDQEGHKMSKTKGNVIDPLDIVDGITLSDLISKRLQDIQDPALIKSVSDQTRKLFPEGLESFGVDVLRLTFAQLASPSIAANFNFSNLKGNKYFYNKLINLANFVLTKAQLFQEELKLENMYPILSIDQWILHEFNEIVLLVNQYLQQYRYDLAISCLYKFIWEDYCSWYVEFTKVTLQNKEYVSTIRILVKLLYDVIKLLFPFTPFLCKSIFQKLKGYLYLQEELEHASYPQYLASLKNIAAKEEIDILKDFITCIRSIKKDDHIKADLLIIGIVDPKIKALLLMYENHVKFCGGINKMFFNEQISILGKTPFKNFYIALSTTNKENPLELSDLLKEQNALITESTYLQKYLENPNFLQKAPPEIIEKRRQRLEEIVFQIKTIEEQIYIFKKDKQ